MVLFNLWRDLLLEMWQIFFWLLWKLADGEARLHLPHPCEGLLDWVNCCGKTQSKRGQPQFIQSGTEYRDRSKLSISLQSVCFPAADIMWSTAPRSRYQVFPAIGLYPRTEEWDKLFLKFLLLDMLSQPWGKLLTLARFPWEYLHDVV